MASIGDTTRPAFAYDQATDTWVPVGIGPHSHTAANVGAVATSSFAAKGDLLVGTGAGTLAAQSVGADGTVLTADSTQADGVAWVAPAGGGGMTVIASGTLSGSQVSITSIPSTYKNLQLVLRNPYITTGLAKLRITINNQTTANYGTSSISSGGTVAGQGASAAYWAIGEDTVNNLQALTTEYPSATITFWDYASTTASKSIYYQVQDRDNSYGSVFGSGGTNNSRTSAISSIEIKTSASTFAGGTYILYGVS